ncbi:MAG: hypothetical protein ABI693_28840 [Bryobacteraceae bacterium]
MKSLLLFLLLAIPVLAQEQSTFFPTWDANIVKELGATDQQQREIRSIIRDSRSRLIDQQSLLAKAQAEIEDAFNEDPFDQRRAAELCDKVINTRADLARTFTQMQTRLRSLLTNDQWRELQRRSAAAKAAQRSPAGAGSSLRR